MKKENMTSTQFHSATEKETTLERFKRFFIKGCPETMFTKTLYDYASNMYGHIAHYDRQGYYQTWFTNPKQISEWFKWALQHPCYGDPAFTRSDVEKSLKIWIAESSILNHYKQLADNALQQIELAELKRLKVKYPKEA